MIDDFVKMPNKALSTVNYFSLYLPPSKRCVSSVVRFRSHVLSPKPNGIKIAKL